MPIAGRGLAAALALLLLARGAAATSDEDKSAVEGLANAMGSTFLVIAIGYLFTATRFVHSASAGGISQLVGRAALPPLLFQSVVALDLSAVNVWVLLASLVTKLVMAALAGAVALVQETGSKRFTNAGVYGLFVTASNDLAIGIPIVAALYPTEPQTMSYLYLLVIMQTVVVNPVCYAVIEYSNVLRARECNPQAHREGHVGRKVLVGVVTNPLVLCCLLGLLYNVCFGRTLPDVVGRTLTTLGSSFTAGALFLTGLSVVGRLEVVRGRRLLVPLLLTALKILVTPIVQRYLTHFLLARVGDSSASEADDLSNFAYIYGALPTGSTVVVIARQFGAETDMIAGASVVCLLLSAPFMFIFSVLFTVSDSDAVMRASVLLSDACCWTGVAGCLVLFCAWARIPRWRRYPIRLVIELAAVQCVYSVAHYGCNLVTNTNSVGSVSLYLLVNFCRLLARFQLTALAANLRSLLREGHKEARRRARRLRLVSVAAAAALTLAWPVSGGTLDREDFSCWYAYGAPQEATDQLNVFVCLLVMAWSLYHVVVPGQSPARRGEEGAGGDLRESLLQAASPVWDHERSLSSGSDGSGDEADRLRATSEWRRSVQVGDRGADSTDHELAVSYRVRVVVLVSLSMLQLVLQVFLTSSILAGESTSGSVAQLLLLSVIVVDGQGMITSLAMLSHPDLKAQWAQLAAWLSRLVGAGSPATVGYHSLASPTLGRRSLTRPERSASTMRSASSMFHA